MLIAGALLAGLASCASADVAAPVAPGPVDPAALTVGVDVSGCGFADPTTGTGVVIQDELVVTSGHVVVQGDEVFVWAVGELFSALIIGFDPANDLALLKVPGLIIETEVRVASLDAGAEVSVWNHSELGAMETSSTVTDVRPVEIQEVLGETRHVRDAFSLELITQDGDSGAGVWSAEGALVGVIFGHTTEAPERGFATAGSVVEAFVEPFVSGSERSSWNCDAATSRIAENSEALNGG